MATRKKTLLAAAAQPQPEQSRSTTDCPLVFISHDTRDADLAEAFGNLLTDASGGILKSFRSSDRKGNAGIEYGQEWYRAIMQKLDDATDVVALLTAFSINRPWILYEAGVAKGKLSANDRVFGIALGVTLEEAATGPFAQFQNSPDEEDAITTLVLQLIRRHPQAAPREEAVRRQVQAFRESVAGLLKGRKKDTNPPTNRADETSVAKFFEEIKVLVGDVPDRVANQLGNDTQFRRSGRRKRFHPMMIEEILHDSMFRKSQNMGGLPILIAFSFFRDDFPWLYELGVQFYQAIQRRNPMAMDRARKNLLDAIHFATRAPMMHMMARGPDDEESLMFLHHVVHDMERLVLTPDPPPTGKSLTPAKKDTD